MTDIIYCPTIDGDPRALNPTTKFSGGIPPAAVSFKLAEDCGLDWSCNKIHEAEQEYPPAMRADEPDIKDIIEDDTAIAIFGFLGGDCFGNIYGCKNPGQSSRMYIYNLSVLQKYQGMGLGSKLMEEFLKISKDKGIRKVTGHFRHNGSLKIARKFNAKRVAVIDNWDGTGEPFSYCVIELAP